MFGRDQSVWLEALKHPGPRAFAKVREQAELVTHNQRVHGMVEIGRRSKADKPESARYVIDELCKGDFAERFLALMTCYGSGDGELVLRFISDKSDTLRSLARRMLSIYGSDEQVVSAFFNSARITHKGFMRELVKRRRFAACDLILASLKEASAHDFSMLLPFASLSFVEAHWPTVEPDGSVLEWARLARHKKLYARERVLNLLHDTPEFERRALAISNTVLSLLSKQRTEGSITILEAMLNTCSIAQIDLSKVLRAFPREVAALCSDSDDLVAVDFHGIYAKLEDEDLLVRLMKRYPSSYAIAKVLKKLPAVSRARVYDELNAFWRAQDDGVLDDGIVEQLPCRERVREARLHLAMESLMTNPQLRYLYAAFLPFPEAREVLTAPMADPEAELRAVAWTAMIGAVRYHRKEITGILNEIKRRKREQDPVRTSIFLALSELPPSTWKAEHLPELEKCIEDALSARDLSGTTASYIEKLLLRIMPFHPTWAAATIAYLWRERGPQPMYFMNEIGRSINKEQAAQIEAQLLPILKHWTKSEYDAAVFRVASIMSIRLKDCKSVVELVRERALNSSNAHVARQAFDVLFTNAFDSMAELVPQLLRKDSSWGTLPRVSSYLSRYRQDLLTPYLGLQRHKGKFNEGRVVLVPDLEKGLIRLSSNQHQIYGKALMAMSSSDENRRYENFYVIQHLKRIPSCPISYFSRIVSVSNTRIYERDLGIIALADLDEGQGVPLLIEAASHPELAYVAVYALRKRILKMPAAEAYEILKKIPRQQITVFKEVVRLLGDIRFEDAYRELIELTGGELHRDVRVAAVCALWSHLDRGKTWEILQNAVDHEEDAVVFTAVRTPGSRLSRLGQKHLLDLLLLGLEREVPRVRMKVLERLAEDPISDPDLKLCDAVIASLSSDSPDECELAAGALVALYGHNAQNVFPAAVRAALPKRRNLRALVANMEQAIARNRSRMLPAACAAITALESDDLTLMLRLRLALASMPWVELGVWLKEMEDKLHADGLAEIGQRLASGRRADIDDMRSLEAMLSTAESETLRRIALYALVAQARHGGWDSERLERLEAFRKDSSTFISEVAQFTLPPEEVAIKALVEKAD